MPLTTATTRRAPHGRAMHITTRGVALITATLLTLVLGLSSPASASDTGGFSDGSGVYRLDSGDELTLFGRHPMFELRGEVVHLVPDDGEDRYVADAQPFDSITFIRDDQDLVTALSFERPGSPAEIASRVDLFEELSVTVAAPDVRLSGSLFVPSGPGPHPAIAIVHGAGPETRENYRLLATSLARRGVAALIYDKRGVGESTGDYSSATFEDLTTDALSALDRLRQEPSIDPDRVGLAGLSQGAWIIAGAAVRSDDVAFLVALSPSGFRPAEAADWLTGSMLAVRGLGERVIAMSQKAWQMMYSSLELVEAGLIEPMPSVPGFWFHALDPDLETVGLWEQVHQPVLALWGELDCQVPAHDSLARLRGALERGPNRTHHLQILAGADHGLVLAGPCERELGATHGGRYHYAEEFLAAPAAWIHALQPETADRVVVLPLEQASSPLGWHQSTAGDTRWHATLLPQAAILLILLILFGGLTISWISRWVVTAVRTRSVRTAVPGRLWALTGVLGAATTLTGSLALVEVLMLGGILSAPLLGDGPVVGVTVMYALTSVLAVVTTAVGVRAIIVNARRRELVRAQPAVAVLAVMLLTAWTAYWGFLPVPMGV